MCFILIFCLIYINVDAAAAVNEFANDDRYAKYIKMKSMLPEGAVRQKMSTDGFSTEVCTA